MFVQMPPQIISRVVGSLFRFATIAVLAGCGGGGLVPVASVTITSTVTTLEVGAKATLSAVVSGGSSQGVTWSSSDPTKVSVNASSGEVTGVAQGTSTITAKSVSDANKTASVTITVNPPRVVSIVVAPPTGSLRSGERATLTATVTAFGLPTTATFRSRDATIATVQRVDGISATVTGIAAGQATIEAVADGDATKVATAVFTVTATVALVDIRPLSPQNGFQLGVGSKLQLSTIPRDAQSNPLTGRSAPTWTSSNTGVATVSSTGEVTAVASGASSITSTIENVTSPALTISVVLAGDPCNVRAYAIGTTASSQFATTESCRQHTFAYVVAQQTFVEMRLTTLDTQMQLIPILARTNASLPAGVGSDAIWDVFLSPGTWVTAALSPAVGTATRYALASIPITSSTCGVSLVFATPGITNGAFNLTSGCAELRIYTSVPPSRTLRVRVNSTGFNPLVELRDLITNAVTATTANDAAGPNAVLTFTATADGLTTFFAIKSRTAGGSGPLTVSIDP